MFGRVAQWRLRVRSLRRESRGRGLPGERRATRGAELRARTHLPATPRTRAHEFGAAFLTELGLQLIRKPAARTVHGASLLLRTPKGKETACALTVKQPSSVTCSCSAAPHRHTAPQRTQRVAISLF